MLASTFSTGESFEFILRTVDAIASDSLGSTYISLPVLAVMSSRYLWLSRLAELTEKYADKKIRFSGDGYEVAHRFFENSALKIEKTPYSLIEQNAVSTAVCAYRKYLSGDFVSDSEFFPTYLRMPSAERERLEKLNQTENKKEGK